MSSSNCCSVTCIQVSQETHKLVWYSHPFKSFYSLLYSISQRFCIVNETEVDVSLGFPCSFYDPTDVGNLVSGSSVFSKPPCASGRSWFTHCWSLAWRILSITLLACEMKRILQYFEHSLALILFGTGMKTDLFQSCGHCWIFQIFWLLSAALSQALTANIKM